MLPSYGYEITILYSGGSRNTYFEPKRGGGNDKTNKQRNTKNTERISHFVDYHFKPLVGSLDKQLTSLTKPKQTLYQIMSYLSLSTFHHCTPTPQSMKELKLGRFVDARTNKHIPTETL